MAQHRRSLTAGASAAALGFLVAATPLFVGGCGGSSPPPASATPDPPLDDEPGEGEGAATPASSAQVKEGVDAIQAGDFAKAKSVLEKAVKENPKDPQAAYYLAVALESLEDGKGAEQQYRHALELDPKLTEASMNLSGLLLDAGDAPGALAVADAALKSAGKSPELLRNRAVALDATESKEAPKAFDAALAVSPDDKELRYLHAESLARTGDAKAAVAEAKRLVAADDVAVLASVGRLLGKLKAFDDCVAALDKALGKTKAAELFVQRGICKHGKKDDAGAKSDFEAAIGADPKFAPAHYYLGEHLHAAGKDKAAKPELEKAKELDAGGKIGAAAAKALSEIK